MTSQAQPILPPTAPFPPDKLHALNSVIADTNVEQRNWLQGFLAGYQAATLPMPAPAAAPAKKIPLTIAYATDSGNSEEVAAAAKKLAGKQGFSAKLVDFADVSAADSRQVQESPDRRQHLGRGRSAGARRRDL